MGTAVAEREKKEAKGLRPWRPFVNFPDLFEEMERFFSLPFERPSRYWPSLLRPSHWVPTLEVFKKGNHLIIRADLPGLKKEDIEVSFEDNDLLIKGERKVEREVKEEDYYRMERASGSFQRCLSLPFEVEPGQVKASFKDGVLEIQIPKPAEAKVESKKVPIT